jgi:hypothetical protein
METYDNTVEKGREGVSVLESCQRRRRRDRRERGEIEESAER